MKIKSSKSEVWLDDQMIMNTNSSPKIDLKNNKIKFNVMGTHDCLSGEKLYENYEIRIYEEGEKEPVKFFLAEVTSFGLVSLKVYDNKRYVVFRDAEFEFDWGFDPRERFHYE